MNYRTLKAGSMPGIFYAFLFIVIFYSQGLLAHSDTTAKVVGAYPYGPGEDVVHDTVRDVYFVTSGGGVLVMDFSQPGNPVVVNKSITMTSRVGDVEFDTVNNLLYVAAHELYVWDVSDINNPVNISVLTHDAAGSASFSVDKLSKSGNTLFSTSVRDLHAIDVTDPVNPVLKDTYSLFYLQGGSAKPNFNGIATKGNFIFATGAEVDMRIFEYSESTGISFIHSTSWSVSTSRSPVVYGNHLFYYSSSFGAGLAVMDISSPDTFSVFSQPVYPQYGVVYAISGTTAVVSSNITGVSTAEVSLIDISDPFNFSAPISTVPYDSLIEGLAVSTDKIVAVTRYDDLQISSYSSTSAPALESTYELDGVTTRIDLDGSLALLSQPYTGVHLVDVSDPINPVRKSTIPRIEFGLNGVAEAGVAYILDKRLIRMFDVADTSAPVLLGQFTLTPQLATETSLAAGLAVSGNIAVASVSTDVEIIDVSQASSASLLSRHIARDYVRNMRIYGNHIYISTSAGLEIIDISNPSSPTEVGFFALRFNSDSIKQGDFVYAIAALDGFFVLDVSNPSKIQQVGFYDVTNSSNAIAVKGNYAMVANTYNGARLFDISDPTNPTPVGLFADKNVRGLVALSDNFLAAGRYVGMKTIQNLLDDGSTGGDPLPDPGSTPDPTPDPAPDPAPDPNQAPVADAGLDQTVTGRSSVTLNGAASYDPDGDNISYQWTQVSGKGVSLSNANTATPSFTAPRVKRRNKVMVFELTVTDTDGLQSTDTVTITAVR